ncbi:MAG: ATP-binding cassette domain-containing protein [Bacteroidota bacterium]
MTSNDLTFSVRVSVQGRSLVAIDDYAIRRDGITMLFGESGIGKSLINRAIYGLLAPDEFTFEVNGKRGEEYLRSEPTREILANGFFVFQEPSSHLHPLLTIGEQLREGSLAGNLDEERILAELWGGISAQLPPDLLKIYPRPFRPSGGEKQRILLAMAFKKIDQWVAAKHPAGGPLFVFDEPTGSLDNRFRDVVLRMLFDRYRRKPFSAVVISHDYSMVSMIKREHADLERLISYRELSKKDGRLSLHPFEPETYLRWLQTQKIPSRVQGERSVVGRVDSTLRVFGRQLQVSADETRRRPTNLILHRGVMTYVKAPSGMGKTTLVKVMMGLLRAEQFRMELDDSTLTEETREDVWRRNLWGRRMTMVFQHADEALNPNSTVGESFRGLPLAFPPTKAAVITLLENLFSGEVAREIFAKKVAGLSGGQKQRLNLLRGLSLQTDLLILDEPLNGLDFESGVRVLEMLRLRLEKGGAILVISHNEEIFDSQVRPEDVYFLGEKQ